MKKSLIIAAIAIVLILVGWYGYSVIKCSWVLNIACPVPYSHEMRNSSGAATTTTTATQLQGTQGVAVVGVPTCTMTATPSVVRPGEPVTFTWTSRNADFAFADSARIHLPTQGTKTFQGFLMPEGNTVYGLEFEGLNGTAHCSASSTVSGFSTQIYDEPNDTVKLQMGGTARSTDGTFSLRLDAINSSSGNLDATVIMTKAGTQTNTPFHFEIGKNSYFSDINDKNKTQKSVGDIHIDLCRIDFGTAVLGGAADFVVSRGATPAVCPTTVG